MVLWKIGEGWFWGRYCIKNVLDYRWWPKISRSESKRGFASMVYWCQNQSESTAPKISFLLKAKKFYKDWLQQHPDTPEEEKFNFQTNGLKAGNWNMEFCYENQIKSIHFLKKTTLFGWKITWRIFGAWGIISFKTFGVDLRIINRDQMPLHRNKSSG